MKYITTKHAAKIINRSEQTIRRLIKSKILLNVKKCPCKQAWLISEHDILTYKEVKHGNNTEGIK